MEGFEGKIIKGERREKEKKKSEEVLIVKSLWASILGEWFLEQGSSLDCHVSFIVFVYYNLIMAANYTSILQSPIIIFYFNYGVKPSAD